MDCVRMKLEIMMTQFIVTYVKWNHTRCLNIDAEQYEKLKKRSTALVLSKLCNGNTFLNFIKQRPKNCPFCWRLF